MPHLQVPCICSCNIFQPSSHFFLIFSFYVFIDSFHWFCQTNFSVRLSYLSSVHTFHRLWQCNSNFSTMFPEFSFSALSHHSHHVCAWIDWCQHQQILTILLQFDPHTVFAISPCSWYYAFFIELTSLEPYYLDNFPLLSFFPYQNSCFLSYQVPTGLLILRACFVSWLLCCC
jgi:hypothetical protein